MLNKAVRPRLSGVKFEPRDGADCLLVVSVKRKTGPHREPAEGLLFRPTF